jgi:hypothetical protein
MDAAGHGFQHLRVDTENGGRTAAVAPLQTAPRTPAARRRVTAYRARVNERAKGHLLR